MRPLIPIAILGFVGCGILGLLSVRLVSWGAAAGPPVAAA
jgi:hypothetical protein